MRGGGDKYIVMDNIKLSRLMRAAAVAMKAHHFGICLANGGGGNPLAGVDTLLAHLEATRDPRQVKLEEQLALMGLSKFDISVYRDARFELQRAQGIASGSTPSVLFSGNEKAISGRVSDASLIVVYYEELFPDLRHCYNEIREVSPVDDKATRSVKPKTLIFIPQGKDFRLSDKYVQQELYCWRRTVRLQFRELFDCVTIMPQETDAATVAEIERTCVFEKAGRN